jgi:hypothetical protein
MNTFENRLSKDTALGGGLVAIAIAWVLFAAAQTPAVSHEPSGASAFTAATAAQAQANTNS